MLITLSRVGGQIPLCSRRLRRKAMSPGRVQRHLGIDGAGSWLALCEGAVAVHLPGAVIVGQIKIEQSLQLLAQFRIGDGSHGLDASIKIARHPVGAADVRLRFASIAEPDDAGVLEIAADDAHHADVVAEAWFAWVKTTHAPDDQLDLHPCL